jgi:hypothetical protein
MTGKQAVKARCRDCLAGSRECTFTDCVLKGLAKGKGKVKGRAIKTYCRWCLNGNPFQVCASPDCALYQFQREREARQTGRIYGKTGGTEGGMRPFTSKVVQTHGKAKGDVKRGVFPRVRV